MHREIKKDCLNRLNRIEGQVRGLNKMIKEGRSYAEITTQISAVQGALRCVEQALNRDHVGTPAQRKLAEVMSLTSVR